MWNLALVAPLGAVLLLAACQTAPQKVALQPEEAGGFEATLYGRVVDAAGAGVGKVDVRLAYRLLAPGEAAGLDMFDAKQAELVARTRGTGMFRIRVHDPDARAGSLAVVRMYAAPPRVIVRDIVSPHVDVLRNGQHREGIEFEVQHGPFDLLEWEKPDAPLPGDVVFHAWVSGLVVDDTGAPVANAHLRFTWGEVSLQTRSDRAGNYQVVVHGVQKDDRKPYNLRVFADDGESRFSFLNEWPVLNNRHLTDMDVVLYRTGAATGRVLDRNGEPVAGAMVGATMKILDRTEQRRPGGVTMVRTDFEGRYTLEALRPGTHVLSVSPGSSRMRQQVEVNPGQVTNVPDIELMQRTTGRIRILDDNGEPLAIGTDIRLLEAEETALRRVFAQGRILRNGEGFFISLPEGEHNVILTVPGGEYEDHPLTLKVEEGVQNNLGEVRLRRAAEQDE